MVDTNLRLRRFTAAAEKLFNLNPIDIGRPVGFLRGKLELTQIEELARTVLETLNAEQREIEDRDGRWFSVTVRPYRTVDNRIEGGAITFVDVDLLTSLSAAEEARDYAEGLIETVREPLLVVDADLRVQRVTSSFLETFQVKRERTLGTILLRSGKWSMESSTIEGVDRKRFVSR